MRGAAADRRRPGLAGTQRARRLTYHQLAFENRALRGCVVRTIEHVYQHFGCAPSELIRRLGDCGQVGSERVRPGEGKIIEAHQCDIVVQFQITGSQVWFTAPLTFAAPPTNPGAPTGVSGVPGDGQCTVSWAAPADTGNSTIDQYVVTTTGTGAPGPITVPGTTTSTVVSPLTNGNSYTFTVHAHTAAGFTGPESTASSWVVVRAREQG